MRRLLTPLIAAGMLVGAGLVFALAISFGPATAQEETTTTVQDDTDTTTEDDTDDDTDDETTDEVPRIRLRHDELVESVLEDLVADGTITQEQADEILAALEERHDELRAELEEFRENHGVPFGREFGRGFGPGFGFELWSLLDDDVIDAEELASLPEDHPLRDADGPAGPYLEDGQITSDELRELHEELRQDGFPFGDDAEERDGTTDDTDTEESGLTF